MMKFTKMQGAGNDFVLVEPDDRQHDWASLAMAMCDRHYGIGADGLLLLLPSDLADFQMRIFNADGSEANACGNGLRCLIKYFIDGGLTNPGTRELSVETRAGVREARIYQVTDKVAKIQVAMGTPKFEAKDIPVVIKEGEGSIDYIKSLITYSITADSRQMPLSLVSVGNPHAVYFCPDPVSDFPLSQLGPKIEQHKIFPRGVNFEVVRVLDRQRIEARVWEKGVGETLACGSGACAITVAARLHGYVDDRVGVQLPGGLLEVEWDGVGEVLLSGAAETVFSGEWLDNNRSQ